MRLTLIPPPSYPIPDTLQTHILRPPTLPKDVKTPAPYLRTKRSLGDVGLSLPSLLCADRTLWWSLAVEEVTWDLETEMVEVRFVDGTEERWELDPEAGFKSSGFVEDSDEEDSRMELDDEAIERAYRAAISSTTTDAKGKGKASPVASSWRSSPSTIAAHLHSLCVQLRNAYEDLALGSIPITDEQDYLHLLHMAANPSARAPPEWSNQSLYQFHMKGSSDDEWSSVEMSDDGEEELLVSPRRARGRSSSPELGEEKDLKAVDKDIDITTSPKRKNTHKGQLKSRRRPASLAPVASTSTTLSLPRARHDYLSFVSLLSTTRRTLLELFSSSIIETLKDRLDTPTYALWAVNNATRWCRREAILKGGEVAADLLRLLHDDGESFDLTDEEEEDELDEKSDEEEWSLRRGFASSQDSPGAKRERKLKRNPLYDLRDDYELKMWCEKAQARARGVEMEEDDDLAGWSVDRGDDLLSSVGAPRFIREIESWEVSKPYPSFGRSPSSRLKGKNLDLVALAAELSSPTKSKSKSNQPLPPPPSAASKSMMRSLYFGQPSTDASPPLTDCSDDDEYLEPGSLHGPAFFCPEDALSEGFLPPRLPKALVEPSRAAPLGREMGMMREKIHQQLNVVAGKKLKDLLEYSATHSDDYAQARTEERRAKSPDIPEPSRLRHLGSPDSSPPRPSSPVSSIPLARQPLRLRLADNTVAASLDTHLGPKKRAAVIAESAKQQTKRGFGKAPKKQPASPRKRARDNIMTIYRATGRSESNESGAGADGGKEGKSKKRKTTRDDEDVIAKMRKKKKSKKLKLKGGGVRVREDLNDEELALLAIAKQGTSTSTPVLGTFPPNSSSLLISSNPLQFPQKPPGAVASAFVIPLSTSGVATSFASPPLTPPSSPPDAISVPSAPRLSPQALSAHRRRVPFHEPRATSARADEDEPMVLSGWQDTYRDGEDGEEDDESVEDILVDAVEELKWSTGEEMDSDDAEDGEEGSESDEEDGEELDPRAPTTATFDIPVDLDAEDDSSDEDADLSFLPATTATEPQWSFYSNWPPSPRPATVSADLNSVKTDLAPRTPSSFPKSFGSIGSLPFVPSSLTPPSSTPTSVQQTSISAFPTSFERDELQQFSLRTATASVIDPTLAALSLDSTTIADATPIPAPILSSSFSATIGQKLWSPIPLHPPTPPSRLTPTPLPSSLASLLSHDIPVKPDPLPAPTPLLSPAPEPNSALSSAGAQLGTAAPSLPSISSSLRFPATVTSPFSLPAVVESPFEVGMDSEEEKSQGEEQEEVGAAASVEPATARAQAGARFISRMLVGEQEQQSQGAAAAVEGGRVGGSAGEAAGSGASATA